MNDFTHFKAIFFEECEELLNTAETNLLAIQGGDNNFDRIHAVFRAIHSIKGGAGSFGFHSLIDFAHLFETLLDALRNNQIKLTDDICELLLRANDVLSDLIQAAHADSNQTPVQLYNVKSQLMDTLEGIDSSTSAHLKNNTLEPVLAVPCESHFHIEFIPKPHLLQFGNEPRFIFNELSSLKCSDDPNAFIIKAKIDHLPNFDELNVLQCYLSFEIELITTSTSERIQESFEFVEDDCELKITLLKSTPLNIDIPQRVSEIEKAPSFLNAAPSSSTAPKEEIAHSIRVELDRIDRLVNTVGEMVIKQAMLLDQAQALNIDEASSLTKGLQDLTHHMRDLQEYVMAIRAQPVKTVFTRMPRLVRELSSELNKDVRLETFGENTEIDKTVIERLGEPLTHMIRNAIDHGIETIDERIRTGKTPYGTIQLSAEHKSGRIVIEICDDGKGINRAKVFQKAIKQGLVNPDSVLSHEEIDNLIFQPGFSTAEAVTNISGRGVGMDVVKKSIQSLGGRIAIQSIEGKGCKFTLTLPLTLAVLDGMIVSCGKQLYIIPLINIIETIRPNKEQVATLVGCHDILNLRSNTIPLLYLHEIFNIEGALDDPCEAIIVIVEAEGGELLGLVVDELHKQQQVVIKSLEENYDPIPGISAATILGNGNVSMILDITALRILGQQQYASHLEHSHHHVNELSEIRRST